MRAALLGIALVAGCAMEPATLDQTVEYQRVDGRDACRLQWPDAPWMCESRVILCANGNVNILLVDVTGWGTYQLDGPVARATRDSAPWFEFDTETPGSPQLAGQWQIAPESVLDCTVP